MSDALFGDIIRALIQAGLLGPVVALLFWLLARELRALRSSVDKLHSRIGILLYSRGVDPDSDHFPAQNKGAKS